MNYKELSLRSHALVVFDGLLKDPVFAGLQGLIDVLAQIQTLKATDMEAVSGMEEAAIAAYGTFCAAILFPAGGNLFAFLRAELKSAVLTDCAFYRFVRRCKDQLSFSLVCRINCPHALYELPEQFESCLVD